MPTPFMHLDVAEQIRAHPDLKPAAADCLDAAWPSFYLGSVAPDVQAVNNMPRGSTHFYTLPPTEGPAAYDRMLLDFPQLADPLRLSPTQAVFVAGYRAHLLLDLYWLHDVAAPFFFQNPAWATKPRNMRHMAHFILLTLLDRESLRRLPATAGQTLAAAPAAGMTPFVPDDDMARWQAMLVEQLDPSSPVRTVEIYAGRLGMLPEEFAGLLDDQTWLQRQLFDRVPAQPVRRVLQRAMRAAVDQVSHYLSAVAIPR